MSDVAAPPTSQHASWLSPERVAYWYLRLNGFLQIENFVVHPVSSGGQRTDVDLIGVRFPHRAERLIDDPDDIMQDDFDRLNLSADRVDVVIAEIKRGPCALNGPWTEQERQNIHRVLAAIGALPSGCIEAAAKALYTDGLYDKAELPRIRLALIGRERDPEIAEKYSGITQVTWNHVLAFVWHRFDQYHKQKTQVDQWDGTGQRLKMLANGNAKSDFVAKVSEMMGVVCVDPDGTA
jgi:hypothetical protein